MGKASTIEARSFERLAFPELDGLYGFALRLTHNRADAEDLAQEAWLRAFVHFDRFRIGTNFRAWIFRILRNIKINQHKRERSRGVRVDFDRIEPTLRTRTRRRHDPHSRFDLEDLDAALAALPRRLRAVLHLYYVKGMSYAEIAGVMRTPVGTVMSRIHRARRRLRHEMLRSERSATCRSRRPLPRTCCTARPAASPR